MENQTWKYSENKNLLLRPNWILPNEYIKKTKFSKKILCVGRLEDQKNFEYIISEFEGSDFEIDIVGIGSKKNNLQNLSIEKGVKVNFLNSLNNNDLIKWYKKSIQALAQSKPFALYSDTYSPQKRTNLLQNIQVLNLSRILESSPTHCIGSHFYNFHHWLLMLEELVDD